MARLERKHEANAPGAWFVDDACIDCDACRQCAPEVFGDVGGQSIVARQPATPEEARRAAVAMFVCPTTSIGTSAPHPKPDELLPDPLGEGVHLVGFNSESSFGASSFLVTRPEGNLLVDAPRWVPRLARRFEELGGIAHVLLTHRDDVADAGRWAERFGARVWIHEADRDAAPFATDVLRGREPAAIRPGLVAIPLPGHTRGSVAYLLEERFLFSGDSLSWDRDRQDLHAFRDACWYSWKEQADSLERLAAHRFAWVLAGHGDRRVETPERMRERLLALVARMRART